MKYEIKAFDSKNKSPKKGKNTSGNPFINNTITFDSMAVWKLAKWEQLKTKYSRAAKL